LPWNPSKSQNWQDEKGDGRAAGLEADSELTPHYATFRKNLLLLALGIVRKMRIRNITPQCAIFLSCIVMQFVSLPEAVARFTC
jgi:hypothetical protein